MEGWLRRGGDDQLRRWIRRRRRRRRLSLRTNPRHGRRRHRERGRRSIDRWAESVGQIRECLESFVVLERPDGVGDRGGGGRRSGTKGRLPRRYHTRGGARRGRERRGGHSHGMVGKSGADDGELRLHQLESQLRLGEE